MEQVLWLVLPLLAACLGAFFAFQSPKFLAGLVELLVPKALKSVGSLFKNNPYTPEEWDFIRHYQDQKDPSASDRDRMKALKLKYKNKKA